ncbi:hypothetical protein BAZSYMB_GCONTIG00626_3 [Bathymodiolus azoricus thioautotrophic gill symbiont]|uniref:Uncharacterized protein n=1 Tax=Bathymodiolus azoricus thioautotrophic gill symbiont TaxID=235205 RepID=A0A1H6LWY6_9GAMM|nr:hypothetical protein BAZSYMB_GCONTIG00626_3 [Bathymodiolus azoricus thioautotrophic gill symbiont]
MSPAFIKGVCKAMRMRETFQQIYQAPDMQTFKTCYKNGITGLVSVVCIQALPACF